MKLEYTEWRSWYLNKLTREDMMNDGIFVRTEQSILNDLEFTFGDRDKAKEEMEIILKMEYELYLKSLIKDYCEGGDFKSLKGEMNDI